MHSSLYLISINAYIITEANALLAGIFAFILLGIEAMMRLFATALFASHEDDDDDDNRESKAIIIVFTIYATISLLSVISICIVVHPLSRIPFIAATVPIPPNLCTIHTITSLSVTSIKLLTRDRRVLFMVPFQVAYGCSSAFLPYYIIDKVISQSDELSPIYVRAAHMHLSSLLMMMLRWYLLVATILELAVLQYSPHSLFISLYYTMTHAYIYILF